MYTRMITYLTYKHTHIHTCTHTHTYTHIHTHTHTYTHTYTHTHIHRTEQNRTEQNRTERNTHTHTNTNKDTYTTHNTHAHTQFCWKKQPPYLVNMREQHANGGARTTMFNISTVLECWPSQHMLVRMHCEAKQNIFRPACQKE